MRLRLGHVRRFVAVGALFSLFGWFAWWRPVDGPLGTRPRDIGDGWTIDAPARLGFDEPTLAASARRLLDGPYDVHSVLVERHGRLVLESYRGGRDRSVYALVSTRRRFGPRDRHDVRSIGKSVTALLYGIALAEHRVPPPERPLSAGLPPLRGRAADNARAIRIGDVLDMASGLDWDEEHGPVNDELRLFWKTDLPAYVLDRPRVAAPGTRFNYNGGGTALLASVIARGTGEPLDRYAEERLFAPLGIRDWTWVADVHGRPMAFNGLRMRPRDLLKLGRLVLQRGRWGGRTIMPGEWIDRLWSPGLLTGVADFRYRGQWWQGTVRWHGRRLAWRAGFGNGGQRLFVIPELDIAVVTTAGAYDRLPTAIAVNRWVQAVVDTVVDDGPVTSPSAGNP